MQRTTLRISIRISIAILLALLSTLALPTTAAAQTTPLAPSQRQITGTVVLDRGCDGQLGGERLLRARIAVQVVDLTTGEVVATVDTVKGRWTAAVPLQGDYGVQLPLWLARAGYIASPANQTVSSAISSTEPAAPLGICRSA